MSRIGKKPVAIPDGVQISVSGSDVAVEGSLGKLQWTCRSEIRVRYDEAAKLVICERGVEDRQTRALHGLTRALIQNMVTGVSKGYEKRLEVVGVGYLAAVEGDVLQLRVGLAHEVHKKIPAALSVACPDQNHIVVRGIDKQQVGEFAAEVRAVRKPEPYKGKGIRYEGERVRRKAGKTAT